MSVVIILLIASLAVASLFLGAFIWSVRSGQYDDDYTPSVRILFEDKRPADNSNKQTHKPKFKPKPHQENNGTTASGR